MDNNLHLHAETHFYYANLSQKNYFLLKSILIKNTIKSILLLNLLALSDCFTSFAGLLVWITNQASIVTGMIAGLLSSGDV